MKIQLEPGEQIEIIDLYNWTRTVISMSHSGLVIESEATPDPDVRTVNLAVAESDRKAIIKYRME